MPKAVIPILIVTVLLCCRVLAKLVEASAKCESPFPKSWFEDEEE